jgi:hypothetical protein
LHTGCALIWGGNVTYKLKLLFVVINPIFQCHKPGAGILIRCTISRYGSNRSTRVR